MLGRAGIGDAQLALIVDAVGHAGAFDQRGGNGTDDGEDVDDFVACGVWAGEVREGTEVDGAVDGAEGGGWEDENGEWGVCCSSGGRGGFEGGCSGFEGGCSGLWWLRIRSVVGR